MSATMDGHQNPPELHLPFMDGLDAQELRWCLESLRDLVTRMGPGPFIAAPVVLPTPAFFPDPWRRNVAGVRILTDRLLHYAGLQGWTAEVQRFRTLPKSVRNNPEASEAGWYLGLRDHTCLFGVSPYTLGDADTVVGTMAHEVAHAWRHINNIMGDSKDEEPLTDLTTVYLGLGVLTTNSALVTNRTVTLHSSSMSTRRLGYLSVSAMVFLLTVQDVLRAAVPTHHVLAPHLLGPQRHIHELLRSGLMVQRNELSQFLGLPPLEEWPTLTSHWPPPSIRLEGLHEPEFRKERYRFHFNEGRKVFRLRHPNLLSPSLGIALGMSIGQAAVLFFHAPAASTLVLGAVTGALALRLITGPRRDTCSDPECNRPLPFRPLKKCPRCGGIILARLNDIEERLDVEERLSKRNSEEPPPKVEAPARKLPWVALLAVLAIAGGLFTLLQASPEQILVYQAKTFDDRAKRTLLEGNVTSTQAATALELLGNNEQVVQRYMPVMLDDGTGVIRVWIPADVYSQLKPQKRLRVVGEAVMVGVGSERKEHFVAKRASVQH